MAAQQELIARSGVIITTHRECMKALAAGLYPLMQESDRNGFGAEHSAKYRKWRYQIRSALGGTDPQGHPVGLDVSVPSDRDYSPISELAELRAWLWQLRTVLQ